jgi:hypothetical protein
MSALGHNRTHALQQKQGGLFDYLVGEQKKFATDGQPKRFCSSNLLGCKTGKSVGLAT